MAWKRMAGKSASAIKKVAGVARANCSKIVGSTISDMADHVVGLWHMNEIGWSTSTADSSGKHENGTTVGYTIVTGGTPTADTEYSSPTYTADKSCDGNLTTFWASTAGGADHWWKYDFGEGVTKTITNLILCTYYDVNGGCLKDFRFEGSTDNAEWDTLVDTQAPNSATTVEYVFTGAPYRYYRIYITSTWRADNIAGFYEAFMTEAGGAPTATGKLNRCGEFNGASQRVQFNNTNIGWSGDFTGSLSIWFKSDDLGFEGSAPFCMGANVGLQAFGVYIFSNGKLGIHYDGGPYTGGPAGTVTTGNWYHFVATKTPGTILANTTMYLNGEVLAYTEGSDGTPNFTPSATRGFFGSWNADWRYQWNGLIDEVVVFDKALSEAEALSLYNSGDGNEL